MGKKKKRRRHRGLRFLILVMGVLIVCGVYQYREYGNIKDVMLKLIGQDPVIYQHVSEEIGEMDGKFYYQQLSEEEQTVYQELLQLQNFSRQSIAYIIPDEEYQSVLLFSRLSGIYAPIFRKKTQLLLPKQIT